MHSIRTFGGMVVVTLLLLWPGQAACEGGGRVEVENVKESSQKHTSALVTYTNTTTKTFKTIVISCVGKNAGGGRISTFDVRHSTLLGDPPIAPGFTRTEEAVFDDPGHVIERVSCEITRANLP